MISYQYATGKTADRKCCRGRGEPMPPQKLSSSIPGVALTRANGTRFKKVVQVLCKLLHGRIALLRLGAQRFHYYAFQIAPQSGHQAGWRLDTPTENRGDDHSHRIAFRFMRR